ncbi:hypothetical protein LVB87_10045 [Lysobacter sp. KIS68-7]|uniref:hypothetical protein n=1 Tax=Lysobacter sp. KIS68-7 TaxID=2904252 RepID=UPI001E353A73|nr:hypothetical protein [Lysobacter sp. KIS68-7]UHQ18550.1 hypothetical protein LVB87_10045 [Lysobacter sp. KIS68-7]
MKTSISANLAEHRVDVAFYGPVSFKDRMDALDVICQLLTEHALHRILLDFSNAWPGTDVDVNEEQLMQKLLAQPVLQGSYMAFVNSQELQGLPSASPETPVPNFVVGRFENHADAVAWLAERGK